MFNAIMTWLTTNGPTVVTLFVTIITSGIDFIRYTDCGPDTICGGANAADDFIALTEAGQLTLFGAAVGLSLYGIRFVRGIIPFTR